LVLPPDAVAREEILVVHTQKMRKVPLDADVNFKHVAELTFFWTGAELEKLVLDSAGLAMEENAKTVTAGHFESAMGKVEINISERTRRIDAMVADMKAMDNVNKAFLDAELKEFYNRENPSNKDRVSSFLRKQQ